MRHQRTVSTACEVTGRCRTTRCRARTRTPGWLRPPDPLPTDRSHNARAKTNTNRAREGFDNHLCGYALARGRWRSERHVHGPESSARPAGTFVLVGPGRVSLHAGGVGVYKRGGKADAMSTMLRPLVTPTFEVLVVDDDPATVAALTDSVGGLARFSYVGDGYQALYELTTRRIDAVVMELFLPGLNGVDLLRRMCSHGLHVPVVVLTHASGAHPGLDALGVRHVLHKPASPDRLCAALTEMIIAPAEADLVGRTDRSAA